MTPRIDALKIAARLETIAATLRRYGPDARRIAEDHRTVLASNGGGPTGKNEISDPTGQVAVAGGPHASAQWADELDRLGKEVADRGDDLHQLVVHVTSHAETGRPKHVAWCANQFGCPADAPAAPGKSGRCASCWRYKKDHGIDRKKKYDRSNEPVHIDPKTGEVIDANPAA